MSQKSKDLIREGRKKQTFSIKTRKKMSLSHKGEKCHWWKGGRSKERDEHYRIMTTFEYRLWRKAVFERDNYTCVWCGDNRGGNLEADHIQTFMEYPELRFAIDNGRTLCKKCHIKRHKKDGGQSIQGHNSNEKNIQPNKED